MVGSTPGSELVGVESKAEFTDLAYDLFMDRETYEGRSVADDIIDDRSGSAVEVWDGTIDIPYTLLCPRIYSDGMSSSRQQCDL